MTFSPIILSRFNSTRLPGKALLPIGHSVLIGHIHSTLTELFSRENIVLATSTEITDNPIASYCDDHNINCFRGDLDNTALRFRDCAESLNSDYIIRVCGDNLFIDLNTLKSMMTIMEEGNYLFSSNTPGRTFPYGMSFEIIQRKYYLDSFKEFNTPGHFEHVTPFFYEKESKHHYFHTNNKTPVAAGLQFAIDTPIDYERATKMIGAMIKPMHQYNLNELVELYHSTQK